MAYENERIRELEAQVSELTNSVTQLTAGLMLLASDGSYAAQTAVDTAVWSGLNRLVPVLQRRNATMDPLGFATANTWYPYAPPPSFQLPSTPVVTILEEGRSVWDRLMEDQIL